MKREEVIWLLIFAALSAIFVLWVRRNLVEFQPVLEASTLFFQLMLAVTVIAVLRNVGGVKSFGVFGPSIIALGILQAGLFWGLVIYANIFLIVMSAALVISPLGIPSSHRIAILIIISGVTITVLELVGEFYHVRVLEAALLFPVLVTSWLADRFVQQVKEIDWIEPSKRVLGTFAITVVAVLVMSERRLVLVVTLNPETWPVLVLLNALIGLKVRFRVSEHLRFSPTIRSGASTSDIMGMNERNREIVFGHNPRSLFEHLSKDRMKRTMHQLDIPTPRSYAIIARKREIPEAMERIRGLDSFVVKPSRGFGGEGIWVVDRTGPGKDDLSVKGEQITEEDLRSHIARIVDGGFTSTWEDVAIVEEKVVTDGWMKPFYTSGVPDIRVIVFEGFPVMAMTRLPTKESEGKANLHKGAIGMGLRISDGRGMNPFWRGRGGKIVDHPDTGARLTDMKVPEWSEVLRIACLAQAASRLGYAGVDIVFDRKGPMVLEVNKRPGLEIQNTNLAGLLRRVRYVESQLPVHGFDPVEERVRLARLWDEEGWR
ncbi:MAG: hypothetical protein L0Z54_04685 [Thermoplasmata archaeon]|nr:hypothetical protein [Thermoplasmata archaeon]